MSQKAVSADIIPNSDVGILSPKTEGTKTKAARVLISWLPRKLRSLKILGPYKLTVLFCYTAETESEVAEKSS
jgi:hypothetical protein